MNNPSSLLTKLLTSFLISSIFLCVQLNGQLQNIEKIYLKDLDTKEYGAGSSFGIAIFGDGFGLVGRRIFKSEGQIGLSASFNIEPIFNTNRDSITSVAPRLFLRVEYNAHVANKLKQKMRRDKIKNRLRKHYVSLKAGATTSGSVFNVALTWRRESFLLDKKKTSSGLDLGPSISYISDDFGNEFILPGIFFRIDANWFNGKRR